MNKIYLNYKNIKKIYEYIKNTNIYLIFLKIYSFLFELIIKFYFKNKVTTKDGVVFYIEGSRAYSRVVKSKIIESKTQEWINKMANKSIFWDIGANIGTFTFMAAKRGMNVVSFEPLPSNYLALTRTLDLNQDISDKIILFPNPIHKSLGINYLNYLHNEEAYSGAQYTNNSFLTTFSGKTSKKLYQIGVNQDFLTKMLPLEFKFPQHIKIDVDGNELLVLNGLDKILLNANMISLMVECNENKTKNDAISFLSELNYLLIDEQITQKIGGDINLFFKKK